ncbi:hypothetical protein [Luteibaculum oceani]|uniref:Uncharacterized protein n=1 Tax=Luteibaculum oceani TaxID=1294296 RepID=A0A5C6V4T2_9FLAO|nr:hypothetical protein [Luteibaculum oceani]TXC78535.1 hypothetical protein FRX97_07390 [Luteibaculum oceani]
MKSYHTALVTVLVVFFIASNVLAQPFDDKLPFAEEGELFEKKKARSGKDGLKNGPPPPPMPIDDYLWILALVGGICYFAGFHSKDVLYLDD